MYIYISPGKGHGRRIIRFFVNENYESRELLLRHTVNRAPTRTRRISRLFAILIRSDGQARRQSFSRNTDIVTRTIRCTQLWIRIRSRTRAANIILRNRLIRSEYFRPLSRRVHFATNICAYETRPTRPGNNFKI